MAAQRKHPLPSTIPPPRRARAGRQGPLLPTVPEMPAVSITRVKDPASTRATVVPSASESRALKRESRTTAPAPAALSRESEITPLFRPIVDLRSGGVFAYGTVFRGPLGDEDAAAAFQEAGALKSAGKLGRTLREALFRTCPTATVVVPLQRAELNDSWLVRPDDPLFGWEHTVYVEVPTPAIADLKHAKGILGEMRSRGARIILTGIGVGRGAFRGVPELEPDLVGLHRDVTAELASDGPMQRLAAGLVRDCVALGFPVVADGVESFEAMCAARDAGIDFAQGDYFGLPGERPPRYDWSKLNRRPTRR